MLTWAAPAEANGLATVSTPLTADTFFSIGVIVERVAVDTAEPPSVC